MTKEELIEALKDFPDHMQVNFVKYPSHKPLRFWDCHEWYVCKKSYRAGGPKDEEFISIMVEDE